MYRASAAPPPLIRVAPAGGAVGCAPLPSWGSTAAWVIRPPRAVPVTAPRSTPSAAATRRATGEAFAVAAGALAPLAPLRLGLGVAGALAAPEPGPGPGVSGALAAPESAVIRPI